MVRERLTFSLRRTPAQRAFCTPALARLLVLRNSWKAARRPDPYGVDFSQPPRPQGFSHLVVVPVVFNGREDVLHRRDVGEFDAFSCGDLGRLRRELIIVQCEVVAPEPLVKSLLHVLRRLSLLVLSKLVELRGSGGLDCPPDSPTAAQSRSRTAQRQSSSRS